MDRDLRGRFQATRDKRQDLEWRTGVAGSGRKVERDDEVDGALRPQDERVGEVVGQAAVHNVDLLALHVEGFIDTIKLIWI